MKNSQFKTICFAYFADGKFIGWYADTFGSIRPDSPKLYRNSDAQLKIIESSFKSKMEKLMVTSNLGDSLSPLSLIDSSLNKDKNNLLQYSEVELRIVECPFYEGPNPNYDGTGFLEWMKKERKEKGDGFKFSDCPNELKNWIYADYIKVKEWANNEPIEFVGTIYSK